MFILILYTMLFLSSSMANADSVIPYYPQNEQLPFVIHICSFNNKPWVIQNLDSVFMQKYENFRVIYVDDQSEDGTVDAVREYLDKHNLCDRVTLVANEVRCRKMKNMYSTMRLCDDDEIIVQLDGDDWLCDDQLLARLNHVYKTRDVWLTYGSYNDYPSNQKGYCASTPDSWVGKKLFRKRKWLYMHPRSFYAWLFKAIKVQDHIAELVDDYQGMFYPSADDQASFWPMIEMAGKRFAYLPKVSYICNRDNPLCGRTFESPLQSACGGDARKRPPYKTLTHPRIDHAAQYSGSAADVVLVSSNNPSGAENMLRSLKKYVTGVQQIAVFYVADRIDENAYDTLKEQFSTVQFIQCEDSNIFIELVQHVQQSTQEHVLLARDKIRIIDDINITTYIQYLETTKAYGVYFAFSPDLEPFFDSTMQQEGIPSVHLYDDVYAWKFSCGKYAFFNNIDLTLMRKQDVLDKLAQLVTQKERQFFKRFYFVWESDIHVDRHAIGLFCGKSLIKGLRTGITAPIPLPCIEVKQKTSSTELISLPIPKVNKDSSTGSNLVMQLIGKWKTRKKNITHHV